MVVEFLGVITVMLSSYQAIVHNFSLVSRICEYVEGILRHGGWIHRFRPVEIRDTYGHLCTKTFLFTHS